MSVESKKERITSEVDELAQEYKANEARKLNRKKTKIIFFVALAVIFITILLVTAILALKLDSYIFPAKLSGIVEDYAQRPLADTEVCIQSKCATTDAQGNYSISGLIYGKYLLTAKADDFEKFSQEIELARGNNSFTILLNAVGIGDVTGKISSESEIIYEDLIITINESNLELNEEGLYEAQGLATGDYSLSIVSPNYIDISAEITVIEGNNKLPEIKLQPAFDLQFSVQDFLSDTKLTDYVAVVNEKEIKSSDGLLIIDNQALQDSFEFKLKADGYNEKSISITEVTQGLNEVGPYTLTVKGKVPYVSERLGYQNVYLANYDGSNEQMLTDNKADSFGPRFVNNNSKLAFFSSRDGLKNNYGSVLELPYIYDLKSNKSNKVSDQNVYFYSFEAMRTAYLFDNYADGKYIEELWVANIDRSNAFLAAQMQSGYMTGLVFANNGDFLMFSWIGYSDDQSGIYRVDLKTKDVNRIYSSDINLPYLANISKDGKFSLFSNFENGEMRSADLYKIDNFSGKVSKITNSSSIELDATFNSSGDYIYFNSSRDGKTDIYRVKSNGESELKLTNDGKVSTFMLLDNGILSFTSEQSLYLLDSKIEAAKPKKITDSVRNDSYHDNLDYSGYLY